jgi:large subunit ribosomal protein L24
MLRIKKNDNVVVVAGKDKGKQGPVIAILPKKGKVIVKGVDIVTRHVKARRQGETSSIKREEAYIDLSKVMPLCSSCQKPVRLRVKVGEDGAKMRVCNRCTATF